MIQTPFSYTTDTLPDPDLNTRFLTLSYNSLITHITLLNLTNNLASPRQTIHHLLALLPSPNSVIALLEQIVQLAGPVHVL